MRIYSFEFAYSLNSNLPIDSCLVDLVGGVVGASPTQRGHVKLEMTANPQDRTRMEQKIPSGIVCFTEDTAVYRLNASPNSCLAFGLSAFAESEVRS
jgi:hypothetical protein